MAEQLPFKIAEILKLAAPGYKQPNVPPPIAGNTPGERSALTTLLGAGLGAGGMGLISYLNPTKDKTETQRKKDALINASLGAALGGMGGYAGGQYWNASRAADAAKVKYSPNQALWAQARALFGLAPMLQSGSSTGASFAAGAIAANVPEVLARKGVLPNAEEMSKGLTSGVDRIKAQFPTPPKPPGAKSAPPLDLAKELAPRPSPNLPYSRQQLNAQQIIKDNVNTGLRRNTIMGNWVNPISGRDAVPFVDHYKSMLAELAQKDPATFKALLSNNPELIKLLSPNTTPGGGQDTLRAVRNMNRWRRGARTLAGGGIMTALQNILGPELDTRILPQQVIDTALRKK